MCVVHMEGAAEIFTKAQSVGVKSFYLVTDQASDSTFSHLLSGEG